MVPPLAAGGDIFVFGCVVYEIMTGSGPYSELSGQEDEIHTRYARGEFPNTTSLHAVGPVI